MRVLVLRRSQEGNVFISKQHAAADPGRLVAAAIPGPRYDVAGKLQLLSTHKSDGSAGFGSKSTAKVRARCCRGDQVASM